MKNLVKRNPLNLERMDSFFDDFWNNSFLISPFHSKSEVSIDAYEENNQFIINADLPGIKVEDVNIELKDSSLSISGERNNEQESKGRNYYRKERSYSSFQRSFILPDNIDENSIKASYNNGVLKITINKKEQPQIESSKRINISTE